MLFHTAGGSRKKENPTKNHLFPAVALEYGQAVLGIATCPHEVTPRCTSCIVVTVVEKVAGHGKP